MTTIAASGVAFVAPILLPTVLRIPMQVCVWRHRLWIWLRYGRTMTTDHNAVRMVAEMGTKAFVPGAAYIEALGRVVLIGREIAETHRQLRHLASRPGQIVNAAFDLHPLSEKHPCAPFPVVDWVIEPGTRFAWVERIQSWKRRLIGSIGQTLGLLYDIDQTANHVAALATSCGLGTDPTGRVSSIWVNAHEMQKAFNQNGEAMIHEIETLSEYIDPYLQKMGVSYNSEFMVGALKTALAGSQLVQQADNVVASALSRVAIDVAREGLALLTFTFLNWIPDILSMPEEVTNPPPELPPPRKRPPEIVKNRKTVALPTKAADIQEYFRNKNHPILTA